ncbi:MAG TPA: Txe/YoeB family addiction module toxin [Methyloradius sp.]
MRNEWSEEAWEDYLHWQLNSKVVLKRINTLIKDIKRDSYAGIGKPEPLKYNLSGFWSRCIDDEHRLVYSVEEDKIKIAHCRYHY